MFDSFGIRLFVLSDSASASVSVSACLSNPIHTVPSLLLLWEYHVNHLIQQREYQMRTIIIR
jgi:hypothetical protein